ncbi:hypothetical protein BH09GEM1_BH09GEM1_00030 [soil metagenome]
MADIQNLRDALAGRYAIEEAGGHLFWRAHHDDLDEARLVLDELCARAPREPPLPSVRGLLALLVGDEQRASAAFSEALERRDQQLFHGVQLGKIFPKVAALRAHPGWAEVLKVSGIDAYLRARSLGGAAT